MLYLKPGTQAIRTWPQSVGQEGTWIEIWLGQTVLRSQQYILHLTNSVRLSPDMAGPINVVAHANQVFTRNPESSFLNSIDHQNHLGCLLKTQILGSLSGWFSFSKSAAGPWLLYFINVYRWWDDQPGVRAYCPKLFQPRFILWIEIFLVFSLLTLVRSP